MLNSPRLRSFFLMLVLCAVTSIPVFAQMGTATLSGVISDPKGGVVPDVEVTATRIETDTVVATKTNSAGIYFFTGLLSGHYHLMIRKPGFKEIAIKEFELHVQDKLEQNFSLELGSVSETVTVTAETSIINTTDASVSTVVDRTYVENMPLNGRSFQDLILLTPGVVTNSPQSQGANGSNGEFSVNGQRTESNYYSVDGVSANVGVSAAALPVAPTPGVSGSLAASTALGTTQSLVSVDALEEFRVQSSTYSAEYGRNPGGQFSFVTRSGSNDWHGTAFDYLRNNIFDANDWFNNYLGVPEPPLRQNDFGGTLGGPVEIPKLYNGKDKTFFFFSYEGLRLLQPQGASVNYVPTALLRQSAASALQPVLNSFPIVNCTSSMPSCISDFGNGVGEFIGAWSNPSQIDSESVRFDHVVNDKLRFFFRFSNTPSFSDSRLSGTGASPSDVFATAYSIRTYTFGMSTLLSSHVSDELRVNYTSNKTTSSITPDSFGGAQPVNLAQLQGLDPQSTSQVVIQLFLDPTGAHVPGIAQNKSANSQRQWNLVDSVSFSTGHHQFKFGVDYRRLTPVVDATSPSIYYYYFSAGSVQENSVDYGVANNAVPAYPLYANFSAFGQDEWRLTSRLSLSMGLRWEVNPAPSVTKGTLPYTLQGDINTPASLALAPQGTPLWRTTWYNFAPRLGVAYVVRNSPVWETVVRGGGGVFFDTGQQLGSQGFAGPGFFASSLFGAAFGLPASFPDSQAVPPVVNPPVAPYNVPAYAFPAHLQLPYTLQWNASVQQGLGKSQALTLSYVGANGRRLLEQSIALVPPNFASDGIYFVRNGLTSSYNALQIQFQRRLSRGLQVLASYTWSHSIDYGSTNLALPYIRGNSDFDVRHNFSSAVSYDLPNTYNNKFASALLHHWGLDGRFTARTGFPVNLTGSTFLDPITMEAVPSELNIVPGEPIYLYGSHCAAVYDNGLACPGGRAINPDAFSSAPPGEVGDAPRNFTRGFGDLQTDLAVRREFPIHERMKLQFRAEAFNVFNHPNFGAINANPYCTPDNSTSPDFLPGCTWGQATATLARSLGVLSPLYQAGGPRSMQFALKLIF
jgi:Carboxypeptidase regulatory-like domain/TonB-dependent Receptor Plug Domain/TonB dependent receptor